MTSAEWTKRLDAAGTWLCEHADSNGHPAPPTRLSLLAAAPFCESAGKTAQNVSRLLQCADCGTYWRVWEHLRVAKAYAAYPHWASNLATSLWPPPRYRRVPVRDIDRIIETAGQQVPDLEVRQYSSIWPGNDDGVWFFSLPGLGKDIQLESPYGGCPFLVETNEQSSYEARTATTVEDAVVMVLTYLKPWYKEAH